jgi:hypothetical protein
LGVKNRQKIEVLRYKNKQRINHPGPAEEGPPLLQMEGRIKKLMSKN